MAAILQDPEISRVKVLRRMHSCLLPPLAMSSRIVERANSGAPPCRFILPDPGIDWVPLRHQRPHLIRGHSERDILRFTPEWGAGRQTLALLVPASSAGPTRGAGRSKAHRQAGQFSCGCYLPVARRRAWVPSASVRTAASSGSGRLNYPKRGPPTRHPSIHPPSIHPPSIPFHPIPSLRSHEFLWSFIR